MQAVVARHGDVDDIGPGVEIEIERRSLIQHPIVDHNLCAFGLGLDAYDAHAGSVTSAKDLLEMSSRGANFIGAAQRLEGQIYIRGLTGFSIHSTGFVEVAGAAKRDRVRSWL